MDGDCTAPFVQNALQTPKQKVQKTGMVRQPAKKLLSPKPQYSPSYEIPDRFSQQYKLENEWNARMEHLNDKYNLYYYSSSESGSESESKHKYETLI